MKINELRIGNWINNNMIPCKITGELMVDFIENPDDSLNKHFSAIELTDQWFIDFGFKITRTYSENREGLVRMSNGIFSFDSKSSRLFFVWDLKYEMKYVHTFQNVYFALTGKELIKKALDTDNNISQ